MTIELKVPFMEKDDAVAFLEYLSRKSCDSRMYTETQMIHEVEYTATIGDFEAFLTSAEMDDVPDYDVELVRMWVSSHKEDFLKFYANHEVGIAYSFDTDDALRMARILANDINNTDCIKNEEECAKHLDMIINLTGMTATLRFLVRNDCVDIDPNTHSFTLITKKPVEDLILDYPGDEIFDDFTLDELRKHKIMQTQYAVVKYQYTVVAGPKFILLDEDDLYDYLSRISSINLMYFDDIFEDIEDCFAFYKKILKEIMPGEVSIDEIIDMLSIPDNDGPCYQVDVDYMAGVLTDLKKLGLITFRNGVANPTKALEEVEI